jgi:hypothetical protein
MRRSASEVIRNLESRIAQLEKSAKSTPITLESPGSQMRGTVNTQTVNGLKEMLKSVQEMYDMGTYIEDPKDEFEEINVSWDYKGWIDLGNSIQFQVNHEINYDGNPYLEVSKEELCRAMCAEGLCDDLIKKFLKRNLKNHSM